MWREEAARRQGTRFPGFSKQNPETSFVATRRGNKKQALKHKQGGAFLNILHMTKEQLFLCAQVEQGRWKVTKSTMGLRSTVPMWNCFSIKKNPGMAKKMLEQGHVKVQKAAKPKRLGEL